MKSTWNDEEFEDNLEEDDLISNQVAFSGTLISDNCLFMQGRVGVGIETIWLSAKSGSIALENKSGTNSECGSESDYEDESEKMMSLCMRQMRKFNQNGLKYAPQTEH